MVSPTPRERDLNDAPVRQDGATVVYWMQQAQRAEDNHALEYAIHEANALRLPVIVIFVLVPDYPWANARHYTFMLQGLRETAARLRQRGLGWTTRIGDPTVEIPKAVKQLRAAILVTDRGYLHHLWQWRQRIAAALPIRMTEVDTDCAIPCTVFGKEEYAAYTFRTKYRPLLSAYLHPVLHHRLHHAAPADLRHAFDVDDLPATLARLGTDMRVAPSISYLGGSTEARRKLDEFLQYRLATYADVRSDAAANTGSHLSPYLHYGQISPLRVALDVLAHGEASSDLHMQSYLDELLVRRELSINYAWHNIHYATPAGWPDWARTSLDAHRNDPRPVLYSREQLALGETGDRVWNAAQKELLASGEIHNYPRMLWAKKLLEWTATPEEAWEIGAWMNDWFALDGRDASGYTNVAWCIGGKHDRPWPERPIYGKVRYMSTDRAHHHFSVKGYFARVNSLCEQAGIAPV